MRIEGIFKAVRPLKNKMHLNNGIFCITAGLAAAGAAAFVLSGLSLLLAIPFLLKKLLWIYGACLLFSLTAAVFSRPGSLKVIKKADSLGLKERLITACELSEDTSSIAEAQRRDAVGWASRTDFGKLYRIKIPRYQTAAALILALLAAASFALPSASRERASKAEETARVIGSQIEKVEQEKKKLEKNTALSDEKLKDMSRKLDQLLEELKKSESEADALKALAKAKHEMEELKNDSVNSELAKLSEKLDGNAVTKELGQAIKDGSMTEVKQKLEQLKQKMDTMKDDEKKQLEESFKEASGAAGDKQLGDSLAGMSQALAPGNQDSMGSSMKGFEDSLAGLMENSDAAAGAAADEIMDMLADARESLGGASGQNGSWASGGGQGQNGQQGTGQSGQGEGQGSGGAGNGSSNGDLGYSGSESGSGARAPGDKQLRDYESVNVPERLGGDASSSQVNGSKSSSGTSTWRDAENAPVEKGSAIPYNHVFEQYKSDAMQALGSDSIPPVMKDIVKDYFSSLE